MILMCKFHGSNDGYPTIHHAQGQSDRVRAPLHCAQSRRPWRLLSNGEAEQGRYPEADNQDNQFSSRRRYRLTEWHLGASRTGAAQQIEGKDRCPDHLSRRLTLSDEIQVWSNDNGTYTRLGDIIPTKNGYLVAFAGKQSTDNNRAVSNHNEPHNVGRCSLGVTSTGSFQTEMVVPPSMILNSNEVGPPFGFFDYSGRYQRQQNFGRHLAHRLYG